jgi:hypothetical protein
MRWQARRAAVPEGQVCLTEVEEYSIGSTSRRYRQCPVLSYPVLYGQGLGRVWVGYVRETRPLPAVGSQAAWSRQGHGDGHIVTLRPPVDACTACYPREYCATSIASGACHVVVALSRNRLCQERKTTTDNGTKDININNNNDNDEDNITTTQLRLDISESNYRLDPTALSRRLA